MTIPFVLDHRLAFVALCGLVLGAGIPLAMAWVRLLPEDAPPFGSPRQAERSTAAVADGSHERSSRRDAVTITLLLLVTLSYALQFPGVPREAAIQWLARRFDAQTAHWIPAGVQMFFAFVPGLAACYSLLRKNFVRIPLIAASFLVLLLWLFGPFLDAAIKAP